MRNEEFKVPRQGRPRPEEADELGQWAIDEYRRWRAKHIGEDVIPEIPPLPDLLASAREKPSGA